MDEKHGQTSYPLKLGYGIGGEFKAALHPTGLLRLNNPHKSHGEASECVPVPDPRGGGGGNLTPS